MSFEASFQAFSAEWPLVPALAFQAINGLASASTLFLVAAGLSIIFGVTRIVNMAHGSFYMLGLYVAVTLAPMMPGPLGFWGAVLAAALAMGALGALVELTVLRRIYRAPELYQLLATFALLLIINDAALWLWGPEDILGPRAPGLTGAVDLLGRRLPQYDILLALIGPIVLTVLHTALTRTRFGHLIRAATQDREMVAALGINEALLFTAVFALGAGLAGLGGALQMPREPANLLIDLTVLGDAFVVVVVGGMGSIRGAYLAALLVAQIKALCTALGIVEVAGFGFNMSKLTLVAEFLVMAVVLILRPHGLFGVFIPPSTSRAHIEPPLRPLSGGGRFTFIIIGLGLAALPFLGGALAYAPVLALDVMIAALFAASLHFLMGPGGLASFGHAASFGLGAYGAAFAATALGLDTPTSFAVGLAVAALGAALVGGLAVRLEGVYFAMLTLAVAQIVWSVVYQWEDVTGGSNGLFGIWPQAPFDTRTGLYLAALTLVTSGVMLLRILAFSPFGYALRAARDSARRAEASGIFVQRVRWLAFIVAGTLGGAAGALFAFAKGSISPETIAVSRSIDGLVMVLLGGVQSLAGPLLGAAGFTVLQDTVMRETEYWRALMGVLILVIVVAVPGGIAGAVALLRRGGGR
ncbi:ABC transporter permease [Ancylobacter sp. WKF20]|uniref:ABC transporter permease n=1 Tax=Ancylobacter sp. WKF20 TaxID=3039801 RepID=UPI00243416F2|nr:ABC transporter permease [Ancylobacter sp. WKF20]WGD29540.1 ABC transporter permease [Ancylobacter sp. WKF20]